MKNQQMEMQMEVMEHCAQFPGPKENQTQRDTALKLKRSPPICLEPTVTLVQVLWQGRRSPSHLHRPAFLCGWFSLGRTCTQKNSSHMASNSSMRCFVLPCRICRSVLYLSRPAFTFSAWRTSFCVFLVSSLAWANSELNACVRG